MEGDVVEVFVDDVDLHADKLGAVERDCVLVGAGDRVTRGDALAERVERAEVVDRMDVSGVGECTNEGDVDADDVVDDVVVADSVMEPLDVVDRDRESVAVADGDRRGFDPVACALDDDDLDPVGVFEPDGDRV